MSRSPGWSPADCSLAEVVALGAIDIAVESKFNMQITGAVRRPVHKLEPVFCRPAPEGRVMRRTMNRLGCNKIEYPIIDNDQTVAGVCVSAIDDDDREDNQ